MPQNTGENTRLSECSNEGHSGFQMFFLRLLMNLPAVLVGVRPSVL